MHLRTLAVIVGALLLTAVTAAQLPEISWTCPMHPDVIEDKKGSCSICGMDLEAARIVTVYTCPVHAVIEQAKPGQCRICSRDLVQKTATLTFTCAGNREISQLEPGTCADGSAMVPKYTPRAHGDHNPKHGGIFFMAPDNWHHLEGTYPAAGRFRVYVFDDFSRPLSVSEARKVRGRVITKEVFDPKTGTTRELASAPLVLARNGAFFEARIEPLALPAKMTAKIAFRSGDKESRFDFAFPSYSRDLPASGSPSTSRSAAPVASIAPPASTSAATSHTASASAQSATADRTANTPNASASAPSAASTSAPASPTATVDKTADKPGDLLGELRAQRAEVESLTKAGTLGAIYVPALRAKDLALEIQSQQRGANEEAVEATVKRIVLSAYQLDTYGDLGDGEKVQDAYRAFSAAISQLDSLVSGRR
jgi:heavy metal-binding protein